MDKLRNLFMILLVALLIFGFLSVNGSVCAKVKRLILGTAGQGGTWYVIGSGIANLVTNYNPDIKMTASSTRGTIENMRLVATKRLDIGMTQPPADYYAYKGMDLFKGQSYPYLRFVCGGHYSVLHAAVPYNSPIKTIADLKGKRVAIGVPGSGVRHICGRALLWVGGIDLDDIKAVSLNQAQGAQALREGSVDAAIFSGGLPNPGLMNLAMLMKVRIIPVLKEDVERLKATYPYLVPAVKPVVIPPNTYRGQSQAVPTFGMITAFTTRTDVSDEVIYKFVSTIFEHRDELAKIHAAGKEYTLETLASGCVIPPHPGALRFFKEHHIEVRPVIK